MSSRWSRIKEIVQDAQDLRAEQRRAFINESCAGDEALQREVESLLRESDQTDSFLEHPIAELPEHVALPDLCAGDVVADRFDILAKLGSGGMGVVYQARDRETGTLLAVKVLHPGSASRAAFIDRFKSELVLARRITHKNVCRVYDLFRAGGILAISMEYVEGESLRAILDRPQSISARAGLEIVRQIVAGLAEAHAQGVIHRDLKPENILIAGDGTVKLMDFGIALPVDRNTSTGVIAGTAGYMSPEQAEGKRVDHRSDIYSMGLIMYEVFCGRRAPAVDPEIRIDLEHFDDYVPPFVRKAILKCVERNPSKRFQSAGELATALGERNESEFNSAETTVTHLTLPVHLYRWRRRDWLLLVAATVSLLIFFQLFSRTYLASRMQIPFETPYYVGIAQEYARRLGAPLASGSSIRAVPLTDQYNYMATHGGARRALELADNPVPYVLWRIEWDNGMSIDLNNGGQLVRFAREFPPREDEAAVSSEDAETVAAAALRDSMGVDPAALRLEQSSDGIYSGRHTRSFTWADPVDYHGLRRHYQVRLAGNEIASLDSNFRVPAGFPERPLFRQMAGYLILPFLMLMYGLAHRRNVRAYSKWRVTMMLFVTLMMAWFYWIALESFGVPEPIVFVFVLNSVIAVAAILWFVLIALERGIHRLGREKLVSTVWFFGRKVLSETCGLAVVRGTLIGLTMLGVDVLLIWFATHYLAMRMDGWVVAGMIYRSQSPALALAITATGVMTLIAVYIAWTASLVARLSERFWPVVFLSATVLSILLPVLLPTGVVQPYPWKLALVFVEYTILVWTFLRFDFLTLVATLSTLAFVSGNYISFVVSPPTGSTDETFAFVMWGVAVIAAAAIAWKQQLAAAGRRLLAVL